MGNLRRLVVITVITSASAAALMGIAALLSSGLGDTGVKVLLTTVVVGLESLAVLCYLSLAGHRLVAVGAAGGLVSSAAAVNALGLIWGSLDQGADWAGRSFGILLVLAVGLAQASLLIRLADGRGLGAALWPTIALDAALAGLLSGAIARDAGSSGYWKLTGVVGILDVLGSLVVLALAAVVAVRGTAAASSGAGRGERLLLTPAVEARVVSSAARAGVGADELVSRALDAWEAASADATRGR